MLSIITTIPHYLAIIPLYNFYNEYNIYIYIIFISTTLSILWHMNIQSYRLFILDYLFAFLNVLCECYYGYSFINKIIFLNSIVLFTNIIIPVTSVWHSAWHILSACKCFYISYQISNLFFFNEIR